MKADLIKFVDEAPRERLARNLINRTLRSAHGRQADMH